MGSLGSAIVFLVDDYFRHPRNAPVGTAFVEAVTLDRIRPLDPLKPVNGFLEKTECTVDIGGVSHRCLVMTIAKATPIDKQLLAVYRDRALLRARAVCWTEGLGLTLDLPKRTAAAPAAAPHPAATFRRQVGPPQAPATVRKTPYTSNLATPTLNSSIAAASSNVLPASDDTRIRSTSAFGLRKAPPKRAHSLAVDDEDSDFDSGGAVQVNGPRYRKKRPYQQQSMCQLESLMAKTYEHSYEQKRLVGKSRRKLVGWYCVSSLAHTSWPTGTIVSWISLRSNTSRQLSSLFCWTKGS